MNDDTGHREEQSTSIDIIHDYGQDNHIQPSEIASAEQLIRRYQELESEIDNQFRTGEKDNFEIDYDLIEHISDELERITQRLEETPITSKTIAKMKIKFFTNMLKNDHPDSVQIDNLKDKILTVFEDYSSAERLGAISKKS